MSTNAQNVARQAFASTAAKPTEHDTAVKIKEALAAREQKLEEHRTKTYLDHPTAITVGDDQQTYVTMQSGRVWRNVPGSSRWHPVGSPLPDTIARETYDELQSINSELADLGYVEPVSE